jgi:hypothetical protein
MSRQTEERNRQKFAEKMREKSLNARNAKLAVKKVPGVGSPAGGTDGSAEGSKKA